MSKVAVVGVEENGVISYLAIQGNKQAKGKTVGSALDSLNEQLDASSNTALSNTIVIVQHLKADAFFSEQDQLRLTELMQQWQVAKEQGELLDSAKQTELEALIERELEAAKVRTQALSQALA